jgi:hypothetical protein
LKDLEKKIIASDYTEAKEDAEDRNSTINPVNNREGIRVLTN